MFNLIIMLISIVLVVGLLVATGYYGGDYLTDGKKQADAAALVNQAQQVAGAVEMYMADNPTGVLTGIADLSPEYLKTVPIGWEIPPSSLAGTSSFVAFPLSGQDAEKLKICEEVNKKLGVSGAIPQCSVVDANFMGCCTAV